MKPVKKFETFEELKSYEGNSVNHSLRLEKHGAFEDFIKSVKTQIKVNSKSDKQGD